MKNYKSDKPCIVCNKGSEGFTCYHHVKTRKSGGSDHAENLMPVCLWHHTEVHKIGLVSFSKKYPAVNNWLINNNWQLTMGKWINENSAS